MISGLLLVDKPEGLTCTRVGARLKRVFAVKKVGHVGTLDPFATGLLPMALGRATAAVRYMDDYDKTYRARLCLGRMTDTLDACGRTSLEAPLTEAQAKALLADEAAAIRRVLAGFLGEIWQVPPLYSAIKLGGRRLYDYAQRGERPAEIPPRRVRIDRIALLDAGWDGADETPFFIDLEVRCGKGTYIRSLCAEIGAALGFPAYTRSLRRTATGPFRVEDAHPLDGLRAETALLPIEAALGHFPVLELSSSDIDSLLCGRSVAAAPYAPQLSRAPEEGLRLLIRGAGGVAGVCLWRAQGAEPPRLLVERMFSDRASYFAPGS